MKKEEITLKNTKTEILEALNAALEREKNISKVKYEPEKEEKEKEEKNAIQVSKENVEQKIFSEELNNKFRELEIAINAEEEKLRNLYGIEKELNNLVIVINAGKDYMAELENNKKIKTEEIQNSIQELEEEYKIKKEELENEYEVKSKMLKNERDREREEYEYKTKREREISNNKWEDEKAQRESQLAQKEIELQKLLQNAEENAEHIKELENQVNDIPKLLEAEYAKGKKETTIELQKEYKYETEILKKDLQNTIDRQNDKIESLKEELEKNIKEKEQLQNSLYAAYIQIKDIASATVEATGGVKIIGSSSSDTSK